MPRTDIRIYGHPSGGYYTSVVKFLPHVLAILMLDVGGCQCLLCEARRRGRSIAAA